MTMKKLSLSIALAVTAGLAASNTSAYVVGIPAGGLLVPMAMHEGAGNTTAVGLINHAAGTPGVNDITVFWSFYNNNSLKQIDGEFKMTPKDFYAFNLAEKAPNFAGMEGYLTFAVGDASGNPIGGAISGSAFQANAADGDAEFIPTFPIAVADWSATTNLFSILPTDLETLRSGATSVVGNRATFDLRYADDGDFESQIVIWATGGLSGNWPVQIYNDDQMRVSGRMECNAQEVCTVRVNTTTLPAKPAAFTNGYVEFELPAGQSGVSYTRVESQTFGAVQTILNTHYNGVSPGNVVNQAAWTVLPDNN